MSREHSLISAVMTKDVEKQSDEAEATKKYPTTGSTWSGLWLKLRRLFPYMWPSDDGWLKLRVIFCVILTIGGLIINVFVPIYLKKIIESLEANIQQDTTNPDLEEGWPWHLVLIWISLKVSQGGGFGGDGLLGNIRSFLWIKVHQYTSLKIQVEMFAHIHDLSLRWHLDRKSGETLRIMDRGTSSINKLLEYLVFNIIPTLIDIVVATVFFGLYYNIWFGLIVFIAMVLYIGITVIITEWRTKFRRKMNLMENDQRTKGMDSLLNAETVKYFSMESWETERYRTSITKYQVEEWKTYASLSLLNITQTLILNGALLALSLYCVWMIWEEVLAVGDFVLVIGYFTQLMQPLNWIGSLYRMIQESFIDMENMFDLLNQEVEVRDLAGSEPYKKGVKAPDIEFENVNFSHNGSKPILQNISFTIPGGTTTALVGTSGSGKTTISKLVVRMFDVDSGLILFDGQNIKTFTKSSLRDCIGVVPQDTVLFNDTVKYNLKYGKMDATDEELKAVAILADLEKTISRFPEGYSTMVGERGLKLSGGEKQRVAIARTLLKNPNVMIFDEATSSLDSNTERNIQAAIDSASKERTTLVVAHRLSTITRAQQILVLDRGRVVERGTHPDLVMMGGKYAKMWDNQHKEQEIKDEQEQEMIDNCLE